MSAPKEASNFCVKMSSTRLVLSFIVGLLLVLPFQYSHSKAESDFYSFTATDIQGREVSLEKYRGKPSLVVNVASACGYTNHHYSELAWIHEQTEFKNLNILAFPCNQFGEQETGENEDIEKFAKTVFKVNFPMFAKIDVIGENAHPVYKYLAESTGKEPTWNFWKYLVNADGHAEHAWGPKVSVLDLYSQLYYKSNKKSDTTEGSNNELGVEEETNENTEVDGNAIEKEISDKKWEIKEEL